MTASLQRAGNELAFYLARAGVGAGLPYAVAEFMAGCAARMARQGMDPARTCASVLETFANGGATLGARWRTGDRRARLEATGGGCLSAAAAAPALHDRLGADLEDGAPVDAWEVVNICSPALPLAALAALERPDLRFEARCRHVDGEEYIDMDGGELSRHDFDELARIAATAAPGGWHITVSVPDARPPKTPDNDSGRDAGTITPAIDPGEWALIERYFSRSLVPSSERSRLAGAGAGLVDTD